MMHNTKEVGCAGTLILSPAGLMGAVMGRTGLLEFSRVGAVR